MAFTTPRTWQVGDEATAAFLNGISSQIGQLQHAGYTTVNLTSGKGTVTHGAPFTPTGVICTPFLGSIYVGVGVTAITSTTFTIQAFNGFAASNFYTGSTLNIYWAVFP